MVMHRLLHQGLGIHQGVFLGGGGVVGRLGAVLAVLRAAAAFGVDDGADIKAAAAEMAADLIGGGAKLFQRLAAQFQGFFPADQAAGQHPVRSLTDGFLHEARLL